MSNDEDLDNLLLVQLTHKLQQIEGEKTKLQESHVEKVEYLQHQVEELRRKQREEKEVKVKEQNESSKKDNKMIADLQAQLQASKDASAKLEQQTKQQISKSKESTKEQANLLQQQLKEANETISKLTKQQQQQQQQQSISFAPISPENKDTLRMPPPSPLKRTSSNSSLASHRSVDSTVSTASVSTEKLDKLKAFRRSRESQLKTLVMDSQNSPTDVQTVIVNLQDELKAAKEVILQQKYQLEQTLLQQQQQRQQGSQANEEPIDDSATDVFGRVNITMETFSYEVRYKELVKRHAQLELDRAYGEFQLRDRITNDAMKYHRRLSHWKQQSQGRQEQLETSMEQAAKERKELMQTIQESQQVALDAKQDFEEYQAGTKNTFHELSNTQDRLEKLEEELRKYRPPQKSDPECLQQSAFVQAAKVRKQEERAWGARLTGIFQQGAEKERAAMG
jgi:chromosome segregation ATPase